jgi:hypothetical protein
VPDLIFANPPFVIHPETGIFKRTDELCAYADHKDKIYKQCGVQTANLLYPMEFHLARGVRAGSRWPYIFGPIYTRYAPFPFLMAYASSFLQRHGFAVELMDCVINRQFGYEEFITVLAARKPEIVLLESSQASEEIDLWLCGRIAEFAEVALAGPHVTGETIPRLGQSGRIKYFLKGEYILSALEMLQTRRPGVYDSTVVEDLDSIPFPDRSFAGAEKACDAWIPFVEWPQLQIWGGKGCPFKCKFCLWPQTVTKGKVSLRSPEKIMEEVEEAVALHGYRHIYFDDDTFNLGNERIAALCARLKKFGLPWGIMARLDTSPLELFETMVDSGCAGMKFGIESFDADVLAFINKRLNRETALRVLTHLSAKYPTLKLHLTMMKDIPGQSQEIHENDLRMLRELGFMEDNPYRTFQLSSCRVFPGTEMARLRQSG